MYKKSEILKIVKEDLLEELGKENKEALISEVKPEINVSSYFVSEAMKELRKENLVELERNSISLTDKGLERSKKLAKKHSTLEKYFRESRNDKEAWKAASILEHYVSMEVIHKLKKISTLSEESVSATEIKCSDRLITDIALDIKLFERMVSMGIFPGERISITSKMPGRVIIEVGNKKFALDEEIAEGIKVLEK